MSVIFSREWAMPSKDTFSVKPIGELVRRYMRGNSVDPFARGSRIATVTNDINPSMPTDYHMDAVAFLGLMAQERRQFDVGVFDPPYSPRQITECYSEAGLKATQTDTQNSVLYKRTRDAMTPLIVPGGIVLSFGWNTVGMGKSRGFEIVEIMTVCHGGAHNDTICMAERKQS